MICPQGKGEGGGREQRWRNRKNLEVTQNGRANTHTHTQTGITKEREAKELQACAQKLRRISRNARKTFQRSSEGDSTEKEKKNKEKREKKKRERKEGGGGGSHIQGIVKDHKHVFQASFSASQESLRGPGNIRSCLSTP